VIKLFCDRTLSEHFVRDYWLDRNFFYFFSQKNWVTRLLFLMFAKWNILIELQLNFWNITSEYKYWISLSFSVVSRLHSLMIQKRCFFSSSDWIALNVFYPFESPTDRSYCNHLLILSFFRRTCQGQNRQRVTSQCLVNIDIQIRWSSGITEGSVAILFMPWRFSDSFSP
jgi:hypothetical protein